MNKIILNLKCPWCNHQENYEKKTSTGDSRHQVSNIIKCNYCGRNLKHGD